ncbi:peptidylprolyl isomerase [Arthrobacter sp. I2-34]|uniref:peptidylprolyl isomerase n=1 Tax=Arthrobacter hankyongi TaxID=2904801 RepID=A0ABS9LD90_9MICC|nr:peptidylprolyl isomerase [Arthrobacter hankyongi]MCG2624626.1 peptidylprolyl isomerase [Arthrobacter hankyongi]
MAANRPDRQMRRRIAQMEARRALRNDQARRRRRDNLAGGIVMAAAVAAGLAVQLLGFGTDPTAAQLQRAEEALQVPQSSASPAATANGAGIPSADIARGRSFTGTLSTSAGNIDVSLDGAKAPQAVSVFSTLAAEGFFTGKNCHRLTTAASMGVLQCGSVDGTGAGDPGYQWGPVENTPADGSYPAGTIAVARGQSTSSNGTQFFITWRDSTIPQDTGGYTIMGKVTGGLDVLRRIAEGGVKESGSKDGAPKIPVSIKSFTLEESPK